ncbi:MAG: hypothetical protein IIA44_08875 [Acidobacteria bacterium]|nr:hypothetical protein [Acidobacteriota bacterium]
MKEMMTMRHRLAVTLGIVAAVLTVAVAAQTDVTGKWNMTFDTDQGTTTATMTLQQDGDTLTGELVGDQGTLEFEGTITGDTLEWVMEVDAGGAFIEIAMDGTVDGDEMVGTADFGGYGGGDWTATRMP